VLFALSLEIVWHACQTVIHTCRDINILRINCTPIWFYLQDYIEMHGQQIKIYWHLNLPEIVLQMANTSRNIQP